MDRAQAVRHVAQAVAAVGRPDVEAGAVVADLEAQLAVVRAEAGRDVRGRAAVLGRVLERLQAAVVDRGLDLGRVAADAPAGDLERPRPLAPDGAQRGQRARGRRARWGRCRARGRAAPRSPRRARPRARRAWRAMAGSAAACSLAIASRMRSETSRCCAPSWRSRSSRRRSLSLAATIRLRESWRSRSEPVHAASSCALSCASSATAPAARSSSGSSASWTSWRIAAAGLPVALDLGQHAAGPRVRDLDRRTVDADPAAALGAGERQPQGGVAERLAQHRLQLAQGGAPQRLDHHAPQHPAREQLRGDEREQEPVPDRRAGHGERPLHHRVDGVRLDLQQARRLEGRLRQQERRPRPGRRSRARGAAAASRSRPATR